MVDSLFDELSLTDEPEEQPEWQEVPQERFLSWLPAMQLAYCAARDIDAASRAISAEEIEWYLARARAYQEEKEQIT